MATYLIEPYGQKFNYDNKIFNKNIHSYNVFFYELRKIASRSGIKLETIDKVNPLRADKLIFFEFNKAIVLKYIKLFKNKNDFKKKSYLFINEGPNVKKDNWNKNNYRYFKKTYTWNDSLVDNKKILQYYIPIDPTKIKTKKISFNKKKLLVLINGYKLAFSRGDLYSKRIEALRYFQKKIPKNFDLYGTSWDNGLPIKYAYYLKDNLFALPLFIKEYFYGRLGFSSYRGRIPDKKKLKVLSKYKFAICFENMTGIDGYITEKIFDCLKAGCVPVYWGANNVQKYIPKECFIDFRDFMNFEKLYDYINRMPVTIHTNYVNSGKKFLGSNKFKKWLPDYFFKKILLKL